MPDAGGLAARVRERLNAIEDPCSLAQGFGVGMDDMGLVTGVDVRPLPDGRHAVHVHLRTTAPACFSVPFFDTAVRTAIAAIEGVGEVELSWGSPEDWSADAMAPDVRRRLAERRERIRARAAQHGASVSRR